MNIDRVYFAESLARLMKQKGISKYQLSKELGFSQSSIANWLNQSTVPGRRSVEALAKYFGVLVPELTGRAYGLIAAANEPTDEPENGLKTEKAPSAEAEDAELVALLEDLRTRDDMRMLFKLAHGATPEDVRQAVKIIEALRKE